MDYNFAVLFVALIIIYIELRRILKRSGNNLENKSENNSGNKSEDSSENNIELNNNKIIENSNKKENTRLSKYKTDIILGILAGICIMLKQSTGLIIAITLLGYGIFLVKSKEEFIKYKINSYENIRNTNSNYNSFCIFSYKWCNRRFLGLLHSWCKNVYKQNTIFYVNE